MCRGLCVRVCVFCVQIRALLYQKYPHQTRWYITKQTAFCCRSVNILMFRLYKARISINNSNIYEFCMRVCVLIFFFFYLQHILFGCVVFSVLSFICLHSNKFAYEKFMLR